MKITRRQLRGLIREVTDNNWEAPNVGAAWLELTLEERIETLADYLDHLTHSDETDALRAEMGLLRQAVEEIQLDPSGKLKGLPVTRP